MTSGILKSASYLYLLLVPFVGAGLAFGIGHVSPAVYVPLWLANAAFMTFASWSLGLHVVRGDNEPDRRLATTAFFFIMPWILISMFAGLGPPPDTAAEWAATATEQQVRYFMLVVSGVLVAFGFAGLREILKSEGAPFYPLLGMTAILIAVPLFVINMLYWGFYLSELFKIQTASQATSLPDWVQPTRQLFGSLSAVEVALTYFATFAFAWALQKAGRLGRASGIAYRAFSLLGLTIITLSLFFPETLRIPGFAVSIPATPLLMPYFMGVNLLRKISAG